MNRIIITAIIGAILVGVGYYKSNSNNPPPEVKPPIEVVEPNEKDLKPINIRIYYPDDLATGLVEVERTINVANENDKYLAALQALFEKPTEAGLIKIFPEGTRIRNIVVNDGLAIVDFDGDSIRNFNGGSTAEIFLIGSVVNTLTNFSEIERVKFLIDNTEVETLSGHMDLSFEYQRMEDLIQ